KKLPLLLIALFITSLTIFAQTQLIQMTAPTDGSNANVALISADGSTVEDLINLEYIPNKISVDDTNDKIYWLDGSNLKIQRSNLDGSDIEDIIVDLEMSGDPSGETFELQVVPSTNQIFWMTNAQIFSADLDGTNVTTNLSAANLAGFLVDDDGQSFWYLIRDPATFASTLYKYDIPQQTNSTLQTDLTYNSTFAKLGGNLFWRSTDGIEKTDLDGANAELVVSASLVFFDILPATSELIWLDGQGFKKANTSDYTVSEILTEAITDVADLATSASNGTFYFSRRQNRKRIQSLDAATGDQETVVLASIGLVTDAQMDLKEQIVYCSDISGYVFKLDLTTGTSEDIYTTPNGIFGLAYSSEHEKLLIQERTAQNSSYLILTDTDGNFEYQQNLSAITFSMGFWDTAQKFYWKSMSGINVSDFTGTDMTTITNNLSNIFISDLAFDEVNEKIYYMGQSDIYTSDMDGTNVATIISNLFIPLQIAVDPYEGYLYYATFSPPLSTAFYRANLDGTDAELIYTSAFATLQMSIALDVPTSSKEIVTPEAFGVKVFPNPVIKGAAIQVQLDELEPTTIRVYNNIGRLIQEYQVNNTTAHISTEDLDQGFYIMELEQKGTRTTKPFIVSP
ncbi:MAG: T9SS type A sorting domain-containing protein, partial [Bacteroidota bacterium]